MIAHTPADPPLSAAVVCGGVPTQQCDNTWCEWDCYISHDGVMAETQYRQVSVQQFLCGQKVPTRVVVVNVYTVCACTCVQGQGGTLVGKLPTVSL